MESESKLPVVAKMEWHDGALRSTIGFIVTDSKLSAGKGIKVGANIAYYDRSGTFLSRPRFSWPYIAAVYSEEDRLDIG